MIVANKLAPGLADRSLGPTGFGSQQIQRMPVSRGRRDNLFASVEELPPRTQVR
ncbi:MAG: hypothetical protein WCB85_13675 [Candidatus Dormiibacterota bacterium]